MEIIFNYKPDSDAVRAHMRKVNVYIYGVLLLAFKQQTLSAFAFGKHAEVYGMC